MRSILTQDLCNEFQQQLIRYHYSEDSLERYIDILTDFSLFGFDQYYSQRLGIDYLIYQFQIRGGHQWNLIRCCARDMGRRCKNAYSY